jgi:hypothetical protein
LANLGFSRPAIHASAHSLFRAGQRSGGSSGILASSDIDPITDEREHARHPKEMSMIEETKTADVAEMRELTLDEIDAAAGAGLWSWLKKIFGGNDPQPSRGPFNRPPDHLK